MFEEDITDPFLFRFKENEVDINKKTNIKIGTASNPKEEEPSPERTQKTPWGD